MFENQETRHDSSPPAPRAYRFGELVFHVYDGGGEDELSMQKILRGVLLDIQRIATAPEANGLPPYIASDFESTLDPGPPDNIA
jgi:hypothetical protein